jgi:hypothetical protein
MAHGLTFYLTPYTFYLLPYTFYLVFGVAAAVYPRPQGLGW